MVADNVAPCPQAGLRLLVSHLRTGEPLAPGEAAVLADQIAAYLDGEASLDTVSVLRKRGGVSPDRAEGLRERDGLLRALWQGHEEFSELPPYAASRLMHLSAKRYEASRWPRERTAIIAPTAEPASTWWKILKSGMAIPAQRRLQQVLATEIQSDV